MFSHPIRGTLRVRGIGRAGAPACSIAGAVSANRMSIAGGEVIISDTAAHEDGGHEREVVLILLLRSGILSLHSARYRPYGVSVLLPASRSCQNENASVQYSIPHGLTIKSPGKPALQLVLLQIARCDPEAVVYST